MTPFASSSRSPKPPDHILTLKEAEALLNPYTALLNQCIQHGWDAWRIDYANKHTILTPRTRAAIVFDEIVAKAQGVFLGKPNVRFERKRNSFLLFIGDRIIIRFKKIGKNGKCSNINTRQQALFRMQQTVLAFPDLKEATMLSAGYSLDELQLDMSSKLVVCQFDNRVLWTIELAGDSQAEITPMPETTPPTPTGPRFEPVRDAETEKEKRKRKEK